MLTPRWYKLRPHAGQDALWHSKARFVVLPCGRRSGKSEIAKRKLILSALDPNTGYDDPNYFAAAPTRDQAKRIYWKDLKALLPKSLIAKTSESEMMIQLVNGASIYVVGMDKPERIEGMSWNGGILDEYANMKPKAWTENVRPALSDRNGWCWLIGVPEGRNHYYETYMYALSDKSGPEWAGFTWKSSEILPESEIESARAALDELTFQQEYEASFVTFEGRCYYPFLQETHCAPLRHLYNPRAPLAFCFDFNVEPGVAAVAQEVTLPNGLQGTAVIGEVYIPRNSNTPAVCRKLIADWGGHQGAVVCYGDATGGSRGSAKVAGSDWDLIKAELRQAPFASRVYYRVPTANPPERARVNAMNSRLKSESGDIRLMVDPQAAPHVVKDLEGVVLLKGGSGEIDKKATPALTHMCFAPGTRVITSDGAVEIEKMPENGFVKTWNGELVKYVSCGQTMPLEQTVKTILSNGESVYCTPDHMFLTGDGWVCAKNLAGKVLITPELLLCAAKSSRCSTDCLTSGTMGKKDISEDLQILANSICTELCGFITTEKFLRECTSITKMEIEQTIRLRILNSLMRSNIYWSITKTYPKRSEKNDWQLLGMLKNLQKLGIQALREGLGTHSTLQEKKSKTRSVNANGAGRSFFQNSQIQCFAATTVQRDTGIIRALMMRLAIANIVENLLPPTSILAKNFVQENALLVTRVEKANSSPVYCMNVPSVACFCLESGAIVSNSDSLGYYIAKEHPLVKNTMTVATYSTVA